MKRQPDLWIRRLHIFKMTLLLPKVYIHCSPNQNPNIFYRNKESHPKIHMETQETPNNQINLEKGRRVLLPNFQPYSNQNCVVLA